MQRDQIHKCLHTEQLFVARKIIANGKNYSMKMFHNYFSVIHHRYQRTSLTFLKISKVILIYTTQRKNNRPSVELKISEEGRQN